MFSSCVRRRLRATSLSVMLAGLLFMGCGPTISGGTCQDECSGVCADLQSDADNCGACGVTCATGESCNLGVCVAGGGESCSDPGAVESCYTGPSGTAGVGQCQAGSRTCRSNGTWSVCEGMITPVSETCANGLDEDCDGAVDNEQDVDGDGWTNCAGDCCDSRDQGCGDPELVNPGAFEAAGNELDDDCDGVVDNLLAACDTGLLSNSGSGLDYAAALDLCQVTEEDPAPENRRWGVISAELTLPDGTGTPNANSHAIRPAFGATPNQFGSALTVLSTGHAAAQGDSNPDFAAFQSGQELGTQSAMPADWLAANGGAVPNAPGCPPPGDLNANDAVMLKLRIRVPTNAKSFSLSSNFFSTEYPEWVCSPFNDFFVILLDSAFTGQPENPLDKNLARYTAPDTTVYPVGVNLAHGNTGLFQQCLNGPTGCTGQSTGGTISTCSDTSELAGTGFDVVNPPGEGTEPGSCGASNLAGGATGWLVTSGNVVPGEIIELRFAIWDTSDQILDSLVLLDNFQWSVEASDPGTVIID